MHPNTLEYIQKQYRISPAVAALIAAAEQEVGAQFQRIDDVREYNQYKVLAALQGEEIALRHFSQTTGYGYDDLGRDALDRVFARALGAEDALVRPQLASGTHALAMMFFGLLMPGDELLSATGKPYDTLEETIGISGDAWGSLRSYGVTYRQVELKEDGALDVEGILEALTPRTRLVHIQRSRGYSWRRGPACGGDRRGHLPHQGGAARRPGGRGQLLWGVYRSSGAVGGGGGYNCRFPH